MKTSHPSKDNDYCADFIGSQLYEELYQLQEKERIAIFLRFWQTHSIAEIAGFLKTDWDSANHLIESSLAKLANQDGLREAHSLLRFYQLGILEENL